VDVQRAYGDGQLVCEAQGVLHLQAATEGAQTPSMTVNAWFLVERSVSSLTASSTCNQVCVATAYSYG
jgi:hypothetical protein